VVHILKALSENVFTVYEESSQESTDWVSLICESSELIRGRVQAACDIQQTRFSINGSSDAICEADICVDNDTIGIFCAFLSPHSLVSMLGRADRETAVAFDDQRDRPPFASDEFIDLDAHGNKS
jgi:hypothetical protein